MGVRDSNLQVIREGMRQAAIDGTARGLNIPGVSIAGKTGTAELDAGKQYTNSWVMGFFPYDNPRYAFAIVMEKGPRTNLTGATFAMRGTVEWMVQNRPGYLGLPERVVEDILPEEQGIGESNASTSPQR
jgi:penicillin-binding protein 2